MRDGGALTEEREGMVDRGMMLNRGSSRSQSDVIPAGYTERKISKKNLLQAFSFFFSLSEMSAARN